MTTSSSSSQDRQAEVTAHVYDWLYHRSEQIRGPIRIAIEELLWAVASRHAGEPRPTLGQITVALKLLAASRRIIMHGRPGSARIRIYLPQTTLGVTA
jgi:hypothetical protein